MSEESVEAAKPAAGGGGNQTIVMIIGVVNLLAVLGLGGYMVFGPKHTQGKGEHAAEPEKKGPKFGPIVELTPIIANLKDRGDRRYAKVSMQLEVKDEEAQKFISEHLAPVRSCLLQYFADLDVAATSGSSGIEKMRNELKTKINDSLKSPIILNVYLTEFVVQ